MTILCGIDVETTGLSFEDDEITEIGWVIKEHGAKRHLNLGSTYVGGSVPLSENITQLTKIENRHRQHAVGVEAALMGLDIVCTTYNVEYMVAHNGTFFDRPMLKAKGLSQKVLDLPWIDTKSDIEYSSDFASTGLTYVAATLGFVNPFPHAALFDVATMLKVLDHYDIEPIIARSKSPLLVCEAGVSFKTKDLAKKRSFRWQDLGDKHYTKSWVKLIRECDLEQEREAAEFDIVVLETLEL